MTVYYAIGYSVIFYYINSQYLLLLLYTGAAADIATGSSDTATADSDPLTAAAVSSIKPDTDDGESDDGSFELPYDVPSNSSKRAKVDDMIDKGK